MNKKSIYNKIAIASALSVLTIYMGCTADDSGNGKATEQNCLTPIIATNSETPTMTRAEESDDPPTSPWGFYEDLYPMSLENSPKIGVFVLQGDNVSAKFNDKPAWFQYELATDGTGNYVRDANNRLVGTWKGLSTNVESGIEYYVYGFMSANNTNWDVQIKPISDSYENGASMTMKGVKSVTATDVCAVVGVLKADIDDLDSLSLMENTIKQGGKTDDGGGIHRGLGNFRYKAEKNNNFIYVWLDHLYSCVNFELQVDDEYSKLRKIKLKQVDFEIDNASTTYDIEVSLMSAGIASTTYTSSGSTTTATDMVFKSTAGEELPSVSGGKPAMSIPGYFAPSGSFTGQKLKVTFKYDVYSTNGNKLTRADATATNTIKIGDLIAASGKELTAGKMFTVKAVIKPTYLYVLADEDLDNPTVVIE